MPGHRRVGDGAGSVVVGAGHRVWVGVLVCRSASTAAGPGLGRVPPVPHLVGAAWRRAFCCPWVGAWCRRGAGDRAEARPSGGGPWPVAASAELAWKESAFVAIVVVAALGRRHVDLVDAAKLLGAGPAQRLGRVNLPFDAPAVAAAALTALVQRRTTYEVARLLGQADPEPAAGHVLPALHLHRPRGAARGCGRSLPVGVLAVHGRGCRGRAARGRGGGPTDGQVRAPAPAGVGDAVDTPRRWRCRPCCWRGWFVPPLVPLLGWAFADRWSAPGSWPQQWRAARLAGSRGRRGRSGGGTLGAARARRRRHRDPLGALAGRARAGGRCPPYR